MEDLELKQQILDHASEKFMSLGIRSVSMDEIATRLGISKKTLYKYVRNKEDLVDQTISRHLYLGRELMNHIRGVAVNAIDEMIQMGQHSVSVLRSTKPVLLHDLQKYYRRSWEKVVHLQSNFIEERISENLSRGINEGIYRKDIDPLVIAKLYVSKTWAIVNESVFPLSIYKREDLLRQHLTYHLHGIVTEQGRTILQNIPVFEKEVQP